MGKFPQKNRGGNSQKNETNSKKNNKNIQNTTSLLKDILQILANCSHFCAFFGQVSYLWEYIDPCQALSYLYHLT